MLIENQVKDLSVRHYKKQDILTELDDTQHNNAQNGTEWQYKNIVDLSIIYVLFIYCNHKSILKFMFKIISVKHYKNQDILTELDNTQHNNAQNATEWQYKIIM